MEMMVMYHDENGIPRAYASGEVETNEDLDRLKDVARAMIEKYAAGKPYPVDLSTFSIVVEIANY